MGSVSQGNRISFNISIILSIMIFTLGLLSIEEGYPLVSSNSSIVSELITNGDFESDSIGIYFQNLGGSMTGWTHVYNFRSGLCTGEIVSGQHFMINDMDGQQYGAPSGEIMTQNFYDFSINESETYIVSSSLRINWISGSTDRSLYADAGFAFLDSANEVLGSIVIRIHRNLPLANTSSMLILNIAESAGSGTDTGWHVKEVNLITDCFNYMVDFDDPIERAEIAKVSVHIKAGNPSLGGSWHANSYFDDIQIKTMSTEELVLDWTEDCVNISDWTDARETGFENYRLGNYGNSGVWALTDAIIATGSKFTPDTNWWNPPVSNTTHRMAAIVREIPSTWDELLINSIIDFDPTSISNPYTFQGGMTLILAGPSFEPLFQINIADGLASNGAHECYHRAWYFDSSGNEILVLPITLKDNPIISQGQLALNITQTTIMIYTPIVNGWIDLALNPSLAFQRGTPTYLVLFGAQNRQLLQPPPTTLDWEWIGVQTVGKSESDLNVPTPPQNLHATSGDNQVILTWEPPLDSGSSSVTSYSVYRSTYLSHYTNIGKTSSLGFVDTSVSNGLTYYYVVSASNLAGESNFSNSVSVIPMDPSETNTSSNSVITLPEITPSFSFIWMISLGIPIYLRRRKG